VKHHHLHDVKALSLSCIEIFEGTFARAFHEQQPRRVAESKERLAILDEGPAVRRDLQRLGRGRYKKR